MIPSTSFLVKSIYSFVYSIFSALYLYVEYIYWEVFSIIGLCLGQKAWNKSQTTTSGRILVTFRRYVHEVFFILNILLLLLLLWRNVLFLNKGADQLSLWVYVLRCVNACLCLKNAFKRPYCNSVLFFLRFLSRCGMATLPGQAPMFCCTILKVVVVSCILLEIYRHDRKDTCQNLTCEDNRLQKYDIIHYAVRSNPLLLLLFFWAVPYCLAVTFSWDTC